MPQFDTTTFTSQIFWLLISWGILFVYLWKFLTPRMNKKLFEREESVKKILAEAQHLNDQAEKMVELYDQKISDAKQSQKVKLKKVVEFIHQSRMDLEARLQEETDLALKRLNLDLEAVEDQIYKDVAAKLEESIANLVEKKAYVKVEENHKISQLLEKEIKRIIAND